MSMTTKRGSMVTYLEGVSIFIVSWPCNHDVLLDQVPKLKHQVSTTIIPMANKFLEVVIHTKKSSHKTYQYGDSTHNFIRRLDEVLMWGDVTNQIRYISTCRRPVNPKFEKLWEVPILKVIWTLITWPT